MAREESFRDRLVWTLVSAAAISIAATLAQSLTAGAWKWVTRRSPPKSLWGASFAGRKAGVSAGRFAAAYLPH